VGLSRDEFGLSSIVGCIDSNELKENMYASNTSSGRLMSNKNSNVAELPIIVG
jgi:hypothetical protein